MAKKKKDGSSVDGGSTVRKTKFKKIKGFLKGEKKKKEPKSPAAATAPDTPTSPARISSHKEDDDVVPSSRR